MIWHYILSESLNCIIDVLREDLENQNEQFKDTRNTGKKTKTNKYG
jgi:hypothetical protein